MSYFGKLIFVSLFLLIFFFVSVPSVSAHFPASDNAITVILHVDPYDAPVPRESAKLYFLIVDKTKRFDLKNCKCLITVSEGGRNIFQHILQVNKDRKFIEWGANLPYVFPNRDVYHISLVGQPVKAQMFQRFRVSWDFRVDQYPPMRFSDYLIQFILFFLVVFGACFGFGIVFFSLTTFLDKRRKRDRLQKNEKEIH